MKVIADLYRRQTHLTHSGKRLTLCGATIDNKFGSSREFYWVGQVGCKGCRNVLADLTSKA